MKEHPIIFRSEMINAIHENRKSMIRRPMKPQPFFKSTSATWGVWEYKGIEYDWISDIPSPYAIGDRLWVKETFVLQVGHRARYNADGEWFDLAENYKYPKWWPIQDTVPSIFMPRWASRIILEVVDVKDPERLQKITEEDASKEGFDRSWLIYHKGEEEHNIRREMIYEKYGEPIADTKGATEIDEFAYYWDSLYTKKPEYQWQANIWVWPIEFRDISKEMKNHKLY